MRVAKGAPPRPGIRELGSPKPEDDLTAQPIDLRETGATRVSRSENEQATGRRNRPRASIDEAEIEQNDANSLLSLSTSQCLIRYRLAGALYIPLYFLRRRQR